MTVEGMKSKLSVTYGKERQTEGLETDECDYGGNDRDKNHKRG